jgi:hypothetical protein
MIKLLKPTNDMMRMTFGFLLLLMVTLLATLLALGKVHQETSYGLEIVLGSLSTMSGMFAQWAFSEPRHPEYRELKSE